MTPQQNRIGDIEAIRAFAILLVFAHHFRSDAIWWDTAWKNCTKPILTGAVGVDLFLVVSGFVIGRSLLDRLETARQTDTFRVETIAFWLRRSWRLLPSAWLWLFIPVLLSFAFNDSGSFGTVAANAKAAAAAFLQVANFYIYELWGGSGAESKHSLFVYWSLSLEEQFYLLLPILVFVSRRRLPIVLVVLICAQCAVDREWIQIWHIRTEGLFAGVLLARWHGTQLYHRLRPVWLERRWLRALFVLVGLLALAHLGSPMFGKSYRHIPRLVISVGLVWAATYDGNYIVRAPWLRSLSGWIGVRSYSLYLVHIPAFFFVAEVFFRLAPEMPVDWRSPLSIGAYSLAAIVLPFVIADSNFRLLELPLRERGRAVAKRYLERRRESKGAGQL